MDVTYFHFHFVFAFSFFLFVPLSPLLSQSLFSPSAPSSYKVPTESYLSQLSWQDSPLYTDSTQPEKHAAQSEPPLPAPGQQPLQVKDLWEQYTDPATGRFYYVNTITKERSWKPPRRARGRTSDQVQHQALFASPPQKLQCILKRWAFSEPDQSVFSQRKGQRCVRMRNKRQCSFICPHSLIVSALKVTFLPKKDLKESNLTWILSLDLHMRWCTEGCTQRSQDRFPQLHVQI